MFDPLRSLELTQLIWAVPLSQLIHEVEEWNIMRWYQDNYVDLPNSSNLSARVWIIVFSLFAYVWTTACFFIPNSTVASVMILLLVAITAQNGLQHVYWLFYFRKYAPGVVTSMALVLPLDGYIVYRVLVEGLMPTWLAMVVVALVVPGLIETVHAGNRMTKTIRTIAHEFPVWLVGRLSA